MKKPVINIEVALALVEKTDDPAKLRNIRDNAAKAGVAAIVDAAEAKLAVNSGLQRRVAARRTPQISTQTKIENPTPNDPLLDELKAECRAANYEYMKLREAAQGSRSSPGRWGQAVKNRGIIDALRQMFTKPTSGLTLLLASGRVEIAFEAIALRSRYEPIIPEDLRLAASANLARVGVKRLPSRFDGAIGPNATGEPNAIGYLVAGKVIEGEPPAGYDWDGVEPLA